MKAIHGGKVKNDKIDSQKMAALFRGAMLPMAYVYSQGMRSIRVFSAASCTWLFRSRSSRRKSRTPTPSTIFLPSRSASLAGPTYNLPILEYVSPIPRSASMSRSMLRLWVLFRPILTIERQINAQVPEHDSVAMRLLRIIPEIGKILALVILYEIHHIGRFPKVANFISYARLVKCLHESACNSAKIGNVHLKWHFSEVACLFIGSIARV